MLELNPLLEPQREKAGSRSRAKYDYQYHWALYRVIEEHKRNNEYAVFVELHEDVVLANSLDRSKARFQFNQIKAGKKIFNCNNLVKPNKGNNSILGKLVNSCINKKYSNKIDEINLVNASGFNIQLSKIGLDFELIKISDLDHLSFKQISEALMKELGINIEKEPLNIQFVVPKLPLEHFQKTIIGEIATFIEDNYPESQGNFPVKIYRALIDELNRKGTIAYDYNQWDQLLDKKSLTSIRVEKVIKEFTRHISDNQIYTTLNYFMDEFSLSAMKKDKTIKYFNKYRTDKLGRKNSFQVDMSKTFQELINKYISSCSDEIQILFEKIELGLPDRIKNSFTSDNHILAVFLYEYINRDANE